MSEVLSEQTETQRKPTAYEILERIAREKVIELIRDEEGEICAVIQNNGHREVWPVKSKTFDSYLNRWFYESEGKGVREEVRKDVKATLEAEGNGKRTVTLNLFSTLSEENPPTIYVDLYTPDWRGVRIDTNGMTVEELPTIFRRFKHLSTWKPELPTQEESPREIIEGFFRTIIPNPQNSETYKLLTPALPVYILPIPRPILVFLGGHGSGKSEAQKMISRVFLKEDAPSAWGDIKDMSAVARQNPILLYDNVTRISEDLARFLSVMVTGERIGCRELYTDKETVYYAYKRMVLLNGIAPNIYAYPDLVDRSLIVTLEKIDEKNRKEEGKLEEEVKPILPKVFGCCLEGLRRAIPLLQQVRADLKGKLPRMADFAVWGEAVARGMGYQPLEWFGLYGQFKQTAVIEAVEANPVSQAVLKLVELYREAPLPELDREQIQARLRDCENRGEGLIFKWKGTDKKVWISSVTVLYGTLSRLLEPTIEGFPQSSVWLTKRLKEVQSSLSDLGIKVEFGRWEKANYIAITFS
jgi:hypothetical protein